MKITASIATAALLTTALNVACAGQAGGQAFADSTGGSSQIRGELAATPAGIVPVLSASNSTGRDAAAQSTTRSADSTGGSSAARAEFLLDHAHADAGHLARNTYQPYLDSTGGTSLASAERALDEDAATAGSRRDVAIAPTTRAAR